MGLFSKIFSTVSAPTVNFNSEKEAFFAVLYACMCADGDVSDEEINSLVTYCTNNSTLSSLDITATYRRVFELKNKVGIEALVSAALPRISEKRRATLFAVSVDFMLADGVVGQKEQTLLEDLQKGLGITEELATKIIEVLMIKNQS